MISKKNNSDQIRKILFTYAGPYPHIGGLSTHMELVIKGLKNLGFDVDVISLSSFPKCIQILFFTGPTYFLNKLSCGLGTIYYHYVCKLFNVLFCYKFLTKKYDMVNAHHINSLPSQTLIKKFRIPVILTVHTYFAYEMISMGALKDNQSSLKRAINYEKKAYNSAAHIITVDSRLKEYLIDNGVDKNKIDVMFNPVDTNVFKPRNGKKKYKEMFNIFTNKKVLLCPRRLEKKNGVIYALLALIKLKREDLVLVYAGDGQERKKIETLIKEHNLKDNVLLLGSVDHENMKFLYNAADIVLIPSIHSEGMEEATSISALEAMASGIPVIASDIGGLRDIIKDNFDGLLVPDKNVEALERAILRLLEDFTLYETISTNSIKNSVENFSYVSRSKLLLRILNNIKTSD
jgi:glycosyltransferase involved in cell wall biosynthesis